MSSIITPGLLLKEEEGGKPTRAPNKIHTVSEIKTSHVPAEPPSAQRQPYFPIPRSMFHVVFSISDFSAMSKRATPIHLLIPFNVDFHV